MRSVRPFYLVLGITLLVVVGIVSFLMRVESGRSHLPGSDLSYLGRGAIPGHLEALKSPDASVRKKAATILWQMGVEAKEATSPLLEVAKDADAEVRTAAVKALGRTGEGTQDAIPGLLEALQDDAAAVRAAAANSLTETWRGMAPIRRSDDHRPTIPPDKNGQPPRQARADPPHNPSPAKLPPP